MWLPVSYHRKLFCNIRTPHATTVCGVFCCAEVTDFGYLYMAPGSLVHRFVVVGERPHAQDDAAADATRALREMLSGGRLSKLVTVKEGGKLRTELVQQDGPIAYVESTTKTSIFEEDANRCILLNTDERPEQTKRIMDATAAVFSGRVAADAQSIIERHHALQRLLQPFQVTGLLQTCGKTRKMQPRPRKSRSKCPARSLGHPGPLGHGICDGQSLLVSISRKTRRITRFGRLMAQRDGHPDTTARPNGCSRASAECHFEWPKGPVL